MPDCTRLVPNPVRDWSVIYHHGGEVRVLAVKTVQESELVRLEVVFRQFPSIRAVYLFGSVARGTQHRDSDLDLAILSTPDCTGDTQRKLKLDILAELARHGFDNVDLVLLDTENILLKYEAIRQNRLVYAVPGFDRGAIYSDVVRKYLDFRPYLAVQREAYKQRVLHDQG